MNAPAASVLRARCARATALLHEAVRQHAPVVHTNSFQAEGVVVTHLIATAGLPIETVSLDTGRLPEETYAVAEALRARYGIAIRWLYPDPEALAAFTRAHGPNAFYRSVELRRQCCALRKVAPLVRALAGKRAWITGRRAAEGGARTALPEREWDEARGIYKFNPLAGWERPEVWAVIRRYDIPYHPLHERNYPSIGCAPCTRPVTAGEDPRAGRWWWEQGEVRECGIHSPVRALRDVRPAAQAQSGGPDLPDVGL